MAWQPATFPLEQLASWTGNAQPGSINHTAGLAEFTFRQTKAQLAASEAQIRAANAEVEAAQAATATAHATEKNAKYMLASVIVAAVAAIASAVSAYFALYGAT